MDDYFSRVRSHNETGLQRQRTADRRAPASPFPQLEASNGLSAPPAIRLRRMPSRLPTFREQPPASDRSTATTDHAATQDDADNRKRSFSAPQRPSASMLAEARAEQERRNEAEGRMATVDEESSRPEASSRPQFQATHSTLRAPNLQGRLRASSGAAWRRLRGNSAAQNPELSSVELADRQEAAAAATRADEYNREVVDILDVIDPEVSTLTTLNNVQNSLFIPNLGRWFNRTATYDLSMHDEGSTPTDTDMETEMETEPVKKDDAAEQEVVEEIETPEPTSAMEQTPDESRRSTQLRRTHTLTSVLSERGRRHKEGDEHNFAVLPHGVNLEGWSDEDKDELNDHVRHLLHSRREGFKRSMRGFGKYVRTPTGFFITLYSFLITFWGAAWVLFLIGWIYVGDRQAYFVEICDQVLTALFCCVGLGLAPFRIVDTYHMIFIAKYHYRTWEERAKRALPDLEDPNDLPEPAVAQASNAEEVKQEESIGKEPVPNPEKKRPQSASSSASSTLSQNPAKAAAVAQGHIPPNQEIIDLEAAVPAVEAADEKEDPNVVLTAKQWSLFKHHQQKFQKSHTFYRPHETYTHHAFPIKLLITVVVLLDFHSIFQACLGGTTWGIKYTVRPKALTAVILTCSICCNIAGGLVISIGDRKTRKKTVVEQMFRQEITKQAMRRLHRKRGLKLPHEAMKPSKEEVAEAKRADKASKSAQKQLHKQARKMAASKASSNA